MKYLILFLVCSLLTVFAYAQEETVSKDPQSDLFLNAHTAASVVDNTGTFEAVQTEYHKIQLDKSCPACNLQGSLNLVDESGSTVTDSSGHPVKTGNGADGESMGP